MKLNASQCNPASVASVTQEMENYYLFFLTCALLFGSLIHLKYHFKEHLQENQTQKHAFESKDCLLLIKYFKDIENKPLFLALQDCSTKIHINLITVHTNIVDGQQKSPPFPYEMHQEQIVIPYNVRNIKGTIIECLEKTQFMPLYFDLKV